LRCPQAPPGAPKRSQQLTLFKAPSLEHGGDRRRGRRKVARPFSPRLSTHLVLRSSKARGAWSLLHRSNRAPLERLIYTRAAAADVKVYRLANVGNHLHLLVKAPTREAFQSFLRTLAGLSARLITGARKGLAQGKFWDAPAYSRVVPGAAFRAVSAYFEKNEFDAIGFKGTQVKLYRGRYVVYVGAPEFMRQQAQNRA
jgi:REP element-mobilizing transposase RayT